MPPRRKSLQPAADQMISSDPKMSREEFMFRIISKQRPDFGIDKARNMASFIVDELKAHDVIRAYQRARQKLKIQDEICKDLAEKERRYIREEKVLPSQPPSLFN